MSKQFYRGYFFTEGRALKVGLKASVDSDLILPQGVRVGMGGGGGHTTDSETVA